MSQAQTTEERAKIGLIKSLLQYLVQGKGPKDEDAEVSVNKTFHRTNGYFTHRQTRTFSCRLTKNTANKLNSYRDSTGVSMAALCAPIIEKFIELHKGSLEESLPLCRNEKDVDKLVTELFNIPLFC
jgi:hypothetical protein